MSRPKLGLALGSGSARGLAHIGVLEVLEREGIPIHCIAGTSIGAVIGGLHATGGLEGYKRILQGLSWWNVMGFFEPAFSRAGLFSGGRLETTLIELTHSPKIEDIGVRFVAVATDNETGQEVRLFRGDLVQALRASFAIPGLFTPVRWDGRWLVDGGVSAPVPVEAAKALGANRILAVNLNTRESMLRASLSGARTDAPDSPVAVGVDETILVGAPAFRTAIDLDLAALEEEPEELPMFERHSVDGMSAEMAMEIGPIDLSEAKHSNFASRILGREEDGKPPGMGYTLTRSIDWMQVELAELQLSRAKPDLVIAPDCGDASLFDYDKAQQMMDAGARAAEEALPRIRELVAE